MFGLLPLDSRSCVVRLSVLYFIDRIAQW